MSDVVTGFKKYLAYILFSYIIRFYLNKFSFKNLDSLFSPIRQQC